MAWIVDQQSSQVELANQFKELINEESILQIPGAHDAMAALVAKNCRIFGTLFVGWCLYSEQGAS